MAKAYNIWHIDAYRGWSDYEGPSDCNYHKDVIMDKSFSKEDVVAAWMAINSDSRVAVVSKCTLVKEGVLSEE